MTTGTMFDQLMTPELLGQAGKLLGLDEQTIQKGLEIGGPLVLGAVGRKAATPEGAGGLLDMLGSSDLSSMAGQFGGGDLMGMLGSLFSGDMSSIGPKLVTYLLGPGRGTVERVVEQQFGIKIGPMLALAAPMILGYLAKNVKEQGLGIDGVRGAVQTQLNEFGASNPLLAQQLNGVLDAGEQATAQALALKASFNADEWTLLSSAPYTAATAVMAAAPNYTVGTAKEKSALITAVREEAASAAPESLLGLVADELLDGGAGDARLQAALDALQTNNAGALDAGVADARRVAALLGEKAPSDAAVYKHYVLNIARRVAEASKEGGFLGFGGTQVSAEEQAALGRLGAALGVGA
jgi:hypothetical protein